MRLTYLFSALAAVSTALASSPNRRSGSGTSPNFGGDLAKRVLYADACATVRVKTPLTITALCQADPTNALCNPLLAGAQTTLDGLLGLNGGVLINYCLCLDAGVLDTSVLTANANQVLYAQVPLALRTGLGGDTRVLRIIRYLAKPLIENQTSNCGYPEHYIPTCTRSCSFICESGFIICGNNCVVDDGTPCPTTLTTNPNYGRRSLVERAACPQGFSACPIPGMYKAGRYECLDTASNVEACGGCSAPFPGNAAGVDCTAIKGAEEVDCVLGKCEVITCEPGFLLQGQQCIKQSLGLEGVSSQRVIGTGKRGIKNVFKSRKQASRATIARNANRA